MLKSAAAAQVFAQRGRGTPHMAILTHHAGPDSHQARDAGSYYCPQCLKRVPAGLAQRRSHHETCASGALDATLLRCPSCGLVLAAEAEPPPGWAQTAA